MHRTARGPRVDRSRLHVTFPQRLQQQVRLCNGNSWFDSFVIAQLSQLCSLTCLSSSSETRLVVSSSQAMIRRAIEWSGPTPFPLLWCSRGVWITWALAQTRPNRISQANAAKDQQTPGAACSRAALAKLCPCSCGR